MSFVNDEVLPLELLQCSHAESHTLKCGETHIKLAGMKILFENALSLLFGGDQIQNARLWQPLLELELPVGDDCLWHNDKEVAIN